MFSNSPRITFLETKFAKGCAWLATHPYLRRSIYAAITLLILTWVSLFLFFTFHIYPHLDDYKDDVETELSKELGVQVKIGEVEGGWNKLRPELIAKEVVLSDNQHQIVFNDVHTILSLRTITERSLQLSLLDIQSQNLQVTRTTDQHILVNQIDLDPLINKKGDNSTILNFATVKFHSPVVSFEDQYQKLPNINISAVELSLRNRGNKHKAKANFTLPKSIGDGTSVVITWKDSEEGGFDQWEIEGNIKTKQLNLAQMSRWIDIPYNIQSSILDTDFSFSSIGPNLTKVDGDISLSKINATLAKGYDPLILNALRGHILYQKNLDTYEQSLELGMFEYSRTKGVFSEPINFQISTAKNADITDLNITTNKINLSELANISKHVPLPEKINEQITNSKLSGIIERLKLTVSTQEDKIIDYKGDVFFDNLSFQYKDNSKAVKNISGDIVFSKDSGQVQLASNNGFIAFPGLVHSSIIHFNDMELKGQWNLQDQNLSLNFEQGHIKNQNADLTFQGKWNGSLDPNSSDTDKYGQIDMTIDIPKAKAETIVFYLPVNTSKSLISWLETGVKSGDLSNGKIVMKGDLLDMPFDKTHQNNNNLYSLSFDVNNGRLIYIQNYPELSQIKGRYQQVNDHVDFRINKATFNNFNINDANVVLPEILNETNDIRIHLTGDGETDGILRLLKTAPLPDNINEATKEMSGKGKGALTLDIRSNIQAPTNTEYEGRYVLLNNDIVWKTSLPTLSNLGGTLYFNNKGLSTSAEGIRGKWMGELFTLKAEQKNDTSIYQAEGTVSISELRKNNSLPLLEQLSGKATFKAVQTENKDGAKVKISSNLQGISSSLVAPFNKSTNTPLNFSIEENKNNLNVPIDYSFSLENIANGKVLLNKNNSILSGQINIGTNTPIKLQKNKMIVRVKDQINFDYWAQMFNSNTKSNGGNITLFAKPDMSYDIKANSMVFAGFLFNDVSVNTQFKNSFYDTEIVSKELQGDIEWYNPGTTQGGDNGLLKANLVGMDLSKDLEKKISTNTSKNTMETLPNLEINVSEFKFQGQPWGKLSLKATNNKTATGNVWIIDPVFISGSETTFRGRLSWLVKNDPNDNQKNYTTLDFKLNSTEVGDTLAKLGYPDTVKRGVAKAEGTLTWADSPMNFSPATLGGNFKMNSQRGQFDKMEPGVGRLLGLLSLQSLPQRFLLDFRDVFTGGMAYENLEGSFSINQGIMKTDNVEIDTPAAVLLMSGSVNLGAQTQDIIIKVRPSLTNGVAIGVAVINPIAGAVTWVADKVLGSPISKLFSTTYHVTGTWADPEVDKKVKKEPPPNKDGSTSPAQAPTEK